MVIPNCTAFERSLLPLLLSVYIGKVRTVVMKKGLCTERDVIR